MRQMYDDSSEFEDRTTYVTLMIFIAMAMIAGILAKDTRIILVGCVSVAIPLTLALAFLRQTWNRRVQRRQRKAGLENARETAYDSPSTRRT
jgi:hypothetical protein